MKLVSDDINTCEWNPEKNKPALSNDKWHASATTIVGSHADWMLCDSCSKLERFNRYKKKTKINYKRRIKQEES